MKYDAFISYRHAPTDIAVSEQIHKRLENIRVPRSIRKSSGKKKIERVFRDQEELTVSSSLSEEILTALDESEYLIVICSPRTPESEWVENEVSYFIKTHGRERILPVIIEGEPKDSFPKPLLFEERREIDVRGETYVYETIAEPFAADYRAPDEKTRKQIIKRDILRLAAPILGCRYDDLKQRHREQRNRRIALGVTAFAVLAVVFGIYNYIQNQKILENFRKQQKTQSLFLADTSLRLLESGDRTNAILVALEALPKDLENPERPVVPQAEYALSKALHAYALGLEMVPDYTIEHQDVVTDNVQASPEGNTFCALDQRGVLNLYDVTKGTIIREISAEQEELATNRIYDYVFTEDRVVAFSAVDILCIDGTDGATIWRKRYNEADPTFNTAYYYSEPYFGVSEDGSTLAYSFAYSDMVYVLDMNDGQVINTIRTDSMDVSMTDIVLSKDGSMIAVVNSDLTSEDTKPLVRVFDAVSDQLISSIELSYSYDFFVGFAPGDRLICGSNDYSIWDGPSKQITMELACFDWRDGSLLWHTEERVTRSILDFVISQVQLIISEEAGNHILLVVENRVFLFDLENGEKVTEKITSSEIVGLAMNKDSGLYVSMTDMGQTNWGNLYTGRDDQDVDFKIDANIMSFVGAFNHIIIVPDYSKSMMVFSYYLAPEYETMFELNSEYSYMLFSKSPDNRYLLFEKFNSDATSVWIYDTQSEEVVCDTQVRVSIEGAIFDEDGVFLAMYDGTVEYFDFASDTMETIYQDEGGYFTCRTNEDQTHFVFDAASRVFLYSTEKREVVLDLETKINEHVVAVSGDAKYLLMSGDEGLFAINTEDHSHVEFEERIELSPVYNVQISFAQNQQYAAIPAADQYIHIVDLESGKTISLIVGMNNNIFSGYFIDADQTFVFHSDDYRIRAANVKSGELVYTGNELINKISQWEFNSDRNLLTALSNIEAIVFSVEEGIYPVAIVPYFVGFDKDAKYVYCMDPFDFGRFPYRELKDLYQMAEDVLGGKPLSEENRIKYYIDN